MTNLHDRVGFVLGRSYDEVPCYRMLELLSESWPPKSGCVIGREDVRVGDYVAFGEPPHDLNTTVGIYLGGGKVIACTPSTGVYVFPWRFVKKLFLWGVHVG